MVRGSRFHQPHLCRCCPTQKAGKNSGTPREPLTENHLPDLSPVKALPLDERENDREQPSCGQRHAHHIEPVARGGAATVDNLRLRCRAHNAYEAERVFGTEFMRRKREQGKRAAERQDATMNPQAQPAHEHARDVMAGLRSLGYRADQARRATESCMKIPGASLEDRMRAALKFLAPKPRRVGAALQVP